MILSHESEDGKVHLDIKVDVRPEDFSTESLLDQIDRNQESGKDETVLAWLDNWAGPAYLESLIKRSPEAILKAFEEEQLAVYCAKHIKDLRSFVNEFDFAKLTNAVLSITGIQDENAVENFKKSVLNSTSAESLADYCVANEDAHLARTIISKFSNSRLIQVVKSRKLVNQDILSLEDDINRLEGTVENQRLAILVYKKANKELAEKLRVLREEKSSEVDLKEVGTDVLLRELWERANG